MTTFDWRDFFESVSQVEQVLRTESARYLRLHGQVDPGQVS